jgi:hypothetical protein
MLVLPVNIDEQLADGAQILEGNRLAVDEST